MWAVPKQHNDILFVSFGVFVFHFVPLGAAVPSAFGGTTLILPKSSAVNDSILSWKPNRPAYLAKPTLNTITPRPVPTVPHPLTS
jgi:hypothetical protein